MDSKICIKCNRSLPLCSFPKRSKTKTISSYCKLCHNKQSTITKKERKRRAVDYLGGKCSICGYDKCMEALDFHHKDSSEKEFSIGKSSIKFEKMKEELDKCILVCANCHREIHTNMYS